MVWPLRKPEPETVAAVDLGSNSFHMIVCRTHNGQLVVVDKIREMVRLAAGLDSDRYLAPEAQHRALECLERFGQRLANLPRHAVRIVGTNTLRSAHNAGEFLEQAEQRLGHPIEIISGVEEARLIYLGVAHSVAADSGRRLVMDIGGGSTEFIVGEGFTPLRMESLHMGCVSMSQRFFADGSITAKRVRAAEIAAQQQLETISAAYRRLKWHTAIGASGTIKAAKKVITAMGFAEETISCGALRQLIDAMLECAHIDELKLPQLDPKRAAVFPGGVIILYAAFKALNIDDMQVSDGALREGLVHDLLGRIHHEDVRDKSVKALSQRYHADQDQAQRIAATAMACFQMVGEEWQLEADQHDLYLYWAAYLYEIGLDISHSNYQKHGAYILDNADLIGFSKQEQQLLAALVLAHRRKFPLKVFKALPKYLQKPAQRLAVLLRLSCVLHRSRNPDALPDFTLSAKGKQLTLQLPADWLEHHRLTEADLNEEAAFLNEAGFELTIQQ